ncbi:MAG TPA: ribonuclease H-like domain-containing protein [Planctomycetota bacterium]|nr:ribonuclease H-like domain-containing protein [Planctomycetota bacterium]
MLRKTFLCFPGITPALERRLWNAGVSSWDELPSQTAAGILKEDHAALCAMIPEFDRRLGLGDAEFFERRLKGAQKLRLVHDFHANMAAVDIETSGIVIEAGITTLVGICTPDGLHCFLADSDLGDAPALLSRHPVIVTFNGSRFDLPILRKEFGGPWGYAGLKREQTHWGGGEPTLFADLPAPPAAQAHIDLMHAMREIGFRGGLKKIEKQVGLKRPDGIDGYDGYQAVQTWRQWAAERPHAEDETLDALKQLIAYNLYDCANLLIMARFAFNDLVSKNDYPFRRFDDVSPFFEDLDETIHATATRVLKKAVQAIKKRRR